MAESAADDSLSPNVLLRPVLERALLPTVAYAGGPAEVAYFAQVAVVAAVLKVTQPRVVPRWSGTVVEDHISRILVRHGVDIAELADPHAVLNRLARASLHADVLGQLSELRVSNQAAFEKLHVLLSDHEGSARVSGRVIAGARASIFQRLSRFERRVVAAAKSRDAKLTEDIETARGALFPMGKRQERTLNLFPLLARYGTELLDDIRDSAASHVASMLGGSSASFAGSMAGRAANDLR
jgi:uncharacterized protein YllA (UPF0747 family)